MSNQSDDERVVISTPEMERIIREMTTAIISAIREEVSVTVRREVQIALQDIQFVASSRSGWKEKDQSIIDHTISSVNTTGSPGSTSHQRADQQPLYKTSGDANQKSALYLYGFVDGAVRKDYGNIGIEGEHVECVPIGDFSAIIHHCSPQPYQSDDQETVKSWILAHQSVIDTVTRDDHLVIPSGFDTIITPLKGADCELVLTNWVDAESESFQKKFEKIRGKQEYGVQIFCDRDAIAEEAIRNNPVITRIERECNDVGPGTAYMLRQSIDRERSKIKDCVIRSLYDDLIDRIRKVSTDIVTLDTRMAGKDDETMLMNLSCLVSEDQYSRLGKILDEINAMQGISIRFTGPWPAYSFV